MKPLNFREPKIALVVMVALTVIVILFYCVASMITSVGYQTFLENESNATPVDAVQEKRITVIIDAGHGGEDPGTSWEGIKEKDLNLVIAQKLSGMLGVSGVRVVMTRTSDRMLYNSGEENQKKYYDLYNRLQIAKSDPDALFVSIHMNSFPAASCKGLQTFYSQANENGKLLAEQIQQTSKILLPDNSRVAKPDSEIFLLKNNPHTSVLVECGFLSNPEEAKNLCDESYQNRLAFVLCLGITNYIEDLNHEDELYLQPMRRRNGEMVWEMPGVRCMELHGGTTG